MKTSSAFSFPTLFYFLGCTMETNIMANRLVPTSHRAQTSQSTTAAAAAAVVTPIVIYSVKLDPQQLPPTMPHIMQERIPADGWTIFWSQVKHVVLLEERSTMYGMGPGFFLLGPCVGLAFVFRHRKPVLILFIVLAVVAVMSVFLDGSCRSFQNDLKAVLAQGEERLFARHGLKLEHEFKVDPSDTSDSPKWLHFRATAAAATHLLPLGITTVSE
jgi:hypothetical protein